MKKPTFAKANISNIESLGRETDALISGIRDGTAVDLQSLLFIMVRTVTFL
jgi:hypothetical protein